MKRGLRARFFAALLPALSQGHARVSEPWRRKLLGGLAGTVLEIGPGTGINLAYLPDGVYWLGLEPNPHLHPWLETALRQRGVLGEVLLGQAEEIPLPQESVDAVVATLVLCSVEDPRRALAEILEANPDLEEEERRRFTALLAKEAARLSRLVEEVLAYTRLQAGVPLARSPTDLKALAEEALALVEPLAREKGIAMECQLAGVQALTDRDRVLQVLLNLLHNALRHARSRVRLELACTGREALFRIQDDGPGVPEEARALVFEPFQSFSGGTGLGLFLARRLVEGLGGRIWLENEGGAVFAFTLPLEVAHENPGGGR